MVSDMDGQASPFMNSNAPAAAREVGQISRDTVRKIIWVVIAFAAFTITWSLPLHLDPQAHKCLAMLILVSVLWATEAMPLWVTSLSIPMLVVVLQIVLKPNGTVLPPPDSSKRELAKIADPNVILLMGGFTIAAALHKYKIDLRLAKGIQDLVGGGAPKLLILANMVVGFVLSMFCNNVAAPVVTFFLATPILHRVPDRRYCCCMVMSIAFACNIGGMPTPIASPQNAQALKVIHDTLHDDVSFLPWMLFSLPICLILLPICWVWLLVWWQPTLDRIPTAADDEALGNDCHDFGPWTLKHSYVVVVCSSTVALWCLFGYVEDFFGNMGIVGLLPVLFLYGPGVLGIQEFREMDWGILMLLGGGAALGDAVQSSGLLDTMADSLQDLFERGGMSAYWQFMFFNVVIITIANFVSHTVAAITLLGVLGKVGQSVGKGLAFVLGGVICDSGACGLPVSSFPNVLAYGVKDQHGVGYLKASDYIVPALVLELVCLATMATLGWVLAESVAF
eukprot:TRINITY_DN27782_c0_g4_i1.p1 TRINITY_DN27782_c0_g4~~TRINITY_DN27782_c0_g4_i1.p1  ORF type:complete len:508 (-),score=57.62 TRINITY_DN27782_c0_g4_i1:70-1593(-)